MRTFDLPLDADLGHRRQNLEPRTSSSTPVKNRIDCPRSVRRIGKGLWSQSETPAIRTGPPLPTRPSNRGRVHQSQWVFVVFGRFLWALSKLPYHPDLIWGVRFGSALPCRCNSAEHTPGIHDF